MFFIRAEANEIVCHENAERGSSGLRQKGGFCYGSDDYGEADWAI